MEISDIIQNNQDTKVISKQKQRTTDVHCTNPIFKGNCVIKYSGSEDNDIFEKPMDKKEQMAMFFSYLF